MPRKRLNINEHARQILSTKYGSSEQLNLNSGRPYSLKFHPVEFYGEYVSYPLRATMILDPFTLDFYEDFDQVKTLTAAFHAMGMKVILYRAFSSLNENPSFLDYWNLSLQEVAPMDLNGTYWVDLPYNIGYEGREAWQTFFINFLKLLFDAGIDGVEFDGGCGLMDIGSFDPETMQKLNQYLASKYNQTELEQKFNITDINSFNFTQYLRNLGCHYNCVYVGSTKIAHPGPDGPQNDEYAKALWKEFKTFNRKVLVEFYKTIMENVNQWEKEKGREFYISTRVGISPLDLPVLQFVDGVNWEYCWFSSPAWGDHPDIIGYPNRTAGVDFRVLQSLNKTFNPWIAPWSSLESTGFTAWFTNGWNTTADPEEQYLGLAELLVYGGLPPTNAGTNQTHFMQFVELAQRNSRLFGQSQFGEIALIYPVATAINLDRLNLTSVIEEENFDRYEGTYYLLADSHRTFDIIVFGDNVWVNITQPLSKLLKYKAIVLPEALCLTDDQVELLEQYLQNGGIIIGIGDVALYNEHAEPVSRQFSTYFDGQVHQVDNGLIVSIKDISPSEYLLYRVKYSTQAYPILEEFENIVNAYLPSEIQTDLPPRAHIYRFFNFNETALIFHIINFNYDFDADKVIRAYNVNFNFTLPPQLKGKELSIYVYSEDLPDGTKVAYTRNGEVISINIPKVSILTSIEVRPHFKEPEPIVINEPSSLSNGIFTFNQSIIVNSSLTILNSQIKMEGDVKPIKIEILPKGSLTIINSTISKETGAYYIVARKGSSIFINSSDISGAGLFGLLEMGGICIETEGAVILNSRIHHNYDFGVLLVNASHSMIGNSIFHDNVRGIAVMNSSYIELFNNTIENNYAGVMLQAFDTFNAGPRLRELIEMCKRGIVPSRGPTKLTVSNCRIINNEFLNVLSLGCNFVTVANSECSGASTVNVLSYQSILKVYNCSVHSSWIGIMLYESPINTVIGNRIYNHSRIGLKVYKCCSMGILHWLHLELVGAVSDEGEVRVIGNYIENNTYGIYTDFEGGPTGYFNRLDKISNNTISDNDVGVYVNRAVGYVIQNNFIGNKKHAEGGNDICGISFYLNGSKKVGNYWDNHIGSEPYEVFTGYYDYYPLTKPAQIPVITDCKAPSIRIENVRVNSFNETHVVINFDLHVSDESYLYASDFIGYFGVVALLGPNMTGREFPWIGFAQAIPGPEALTKSFSIYNFTFFQGLTENGSLVPFPKEWVENATLTVYATDMWGNWNKNDTKAPYIKVVYRTPQTVYENDQVTLWLHVSDWSEISKVQVIYFNGSAWNTLDANFDRENHLYYAVIPPHRIGTTIKYSVYAEDVYGNGATYSDEYYTYTVIQEYPLSIVILILLTLATAPIILIKRKFMMQQT